MEEKIETGKEIRERRKPTYKRLVILMWILTILGILGVVGLFMTLSNGDLPSFEDLENPKNNLATEVYASNGEVLGRFYVENRIPVTYDQLSPHLIDALIATEDERFEEHSGIDIEALFRVMGKTVLLNNKNAGGASTITQQLAKMLFTDSPASGIERVVQKLKEWIIALKLEKSYDKEEILAMYLNKFSFLNGAYGIKAAAENYFGKGQDSLNIQEAATLVGMLKNPALFNPVRRPDTTKHRREVVLKQMVKNNKLEQAEYDSLRLLPMDMTNFKRKTHTDGLAPYFRMKLGEDVKSMLRKEENLRTDGKPYNIYRDGLKIYTTLDPVIQKYAEESMLEHMTKLQKKFFKVWKDKDPWTFRDPEITEEEDLIKLDEDIEIRKRSLNKLLRSSDRFLTLRNKFLKTNLAEIQKEFKYELRDIDIERMLSEEEESGHLAKLVAQKFIQSPRAMKYKKIMQTETWKSLKKNWNDLNKAAEESFAAPAKMTVFAYNDRMEKDTMMSPLDSIKYHRMFLQLGSMAVDPQTGYVKAWVGGINHKYFQFDHVTSDRQVGSTFKPFIYATAIAQQGFSPCYKVLDVAHTIHKNEGNFNLLEDWTPANANNEYSGKEFTLMKGLQWSKNTVSVYLMKMLGDTDPVRELVHNMGLDKNKKRGNGTFRIPRQPAICLGATDLTVREMTGAYTSFANNGTYNKPVYISRIEDKNGRVIFQDIPEDRIALDPNANYVMLSMLRHVMNQGLPGFSKIVSQVGGKTGTTNDYVDGWFMGVTPSLVVGTWVGGEDRWVRFLSLSDGIGAKMARPFFAKLLQKLENDPEVDYDKNARFKIPSGDIGIELDCSKYINDERGDYYTNPENTGGFQEDESFGDDMFGDEEEEEGLDSLQNPNGPLAEDNDEDEEFQEEF